MAYGDKTHHVKEEDILFGEVGQKDLSDELQKTLAELLEEHVQTREKIRKFEKENNHFFRPAMEYFNEVELETIGKEFAEFDRSVIHERYKAVVSSIES